MGHAGFCPGLLEGPWVRQHWDELQNCKAETTEQQNNRAAVSGVTLSTNYEYSSTWIILANIASNLIL